MNSAEKIKINGIAHIILTVSVIEKSKPFYVALGNFFSLTCVCDTEELLYYVGGRTAIGIEPASKENQKKR